MVRNSFSADILPVRPFSIFLAHETFNFFLGAKFTINLAHLILLLQDICAVAQNFAKFVLIS